MSMPLEEKDLKYYGNYRAKVINNDDPRMLGRVQAEIYPMFVYTDAAMTANLPWCVPAMPLSVGAGISTEDASTWGSGQTYQVGGKAKKDGRTYTCLIGHTSTVFAEDMKAGKWKAEGYGSFMVPDVGTFIWVFFEAGDPYQPVYFAEATTASFGLPSSREGNYPNTRVVRTKNGIQFKFDDTEGEEDIRVDHPSGSWVEFFPDGRVTVHTATEDGVILIETDNADIDVLAKKGNISVIAEEGDILVDAEKGDIDVWAEEGNVWITAGDEKAITVSAPDGSIELDAAVVSTTKSLEAGNSADGTFLSADGKTVTVKRGITTTIV